MVTVMILSKIQYVIWIQENRKNTESYWEGQEKIPTPGGSYGH